MTFLSHLSELAGQLLAQDSGIAGEGQSGFEIDDAILNQLRNLTVKMLHAIRNAGLHGVEKTLVFAFALFNAFASARVGLQDFECRNSTAPVVLRHEPLADDVAERLRKTLAHRLLFRGREMN